VRFAAIATGTRAAAPAEVFHAAEFTPTERRCGTMTPWPPNAPRGAEDRAEVAGIGDAVERDEEGGRVAGEHLIEQLDRVRVLVGRHLECEALVHAALAGEAVELGPHDLEHGDAAVGGDLHRLLHPVVHLDARGDVEGRGGDAGAQRLDDGVAAGHDLGLVARLGAREAPDAPRGAPRAGLADLAWPGPLPPRPVALSAALRLPAGARRGPPPWGRALALERLRPWPPEPTCLPLALAHGSGARLACCPS
jgi:hypothetical protein